MSEEHAAHSPLAQFEVIPLHSNPIHVLGYDVSFTNAALWMVLTVVAIVAFLLPASRKLSLVPNRLQSSAEILVDFIDDTLKEVAGKEALPYFSFIFTLFIFILFCNLMGMIPSSFAVTSHIIVTFAMAAFVFVGVTLVAILKNGPVKFLKFFLPEGTPWWIAWLVIPIELVSYLARPASLSIRLAANMTAGHITLKVLATLVVTFGILGDGLVSNILGGGGMFTLLFLLTAFEFGIAIIQAYIFTLLACVYLNDALHLH
ncbi:MAG: F0F1 ATP synthase subunit A [Pseudomonadota bacterium]